MYKIIILIPFLISINEAFCQRDCEYYYEYYGQLSIKNKITSDIIIYLPQANYLKMDPKKEKDQ